MGRLAYTLLPLTAEHPPFADVHWRTLQGLVLGAMLHGSSAGVKAVRRLRACGLPEKRGSF